MPPQIASVVYWGAIFALMLWDQRRLGRTSLALWLPLIWMLIGASRNASEWLGMGISIEGAAQMAEGSPLDALLVFGLLAAGLLVLSMRGRRTIDVLQANSHIVLFVGLCALSALWSDLPFVTFKRWTKTLGNVVMIFVVLTDPNPVAAVKRLVARLGFVLLMSSLLLVKYYPALGRLYDSYTGATVFTGVTTNKNSLGCLCFVLSLGMLWLLLEGFYEEGRKRQHLVVFGGMFAIGLWLLIQSNSATSLACFVVGATLMLVVHRSKPRVRPAILHFALGTAAVAAFLGYAVFDVQTYFIEAMGRDPTLTGRTELWATLMEMDVSPLLGAGAESFFLGDRLTYLWTKYWWHPNQAHNGYLEIYLTLGWVGVSLFAMLILAGYRRIIQAYRDEPRSASLRLAFWITFIIYNMTEAAVKVLHPVWLVFLLAIAASAPKLRELRARKLAA